MNLVELLKFLPLLIGAFLAYHLIFKLQLPSKSLGSILTYFLGIIIVFLALSWFITSFLADWANDLLTAGTQGAEWEQFIDASENVVDDAFTDTTTTGGAAAPVPTPIVILATPTIPGVAAGQSGIEVVPNTNPSTYTVVAGDTLNDIARRFGVPLNDLIVANNIQNPNTINQGQVLIIPAR